MSSVNSCIWFVWAFSICTNPGFVLSFRAHAPACILLKPMRTNRSAPSNLPTSNLSLELLGVA